MPKSLPEVNVWILVKSGLKFFKGTKIWIKKIFRNVENKRHRIKGDVYDALNKIKGVRTDINWSQITAPIKSAAAAPRTCQLGCPAAACSQHGSHRSQLPPITGTEFWDTIKKNNVAIHKLELIVIIMCVHDICGGGGTCHITLVEAVGKPWSQCSHLPFPWVLEIEPGSSGFCCSASATETS